MKIGRHIRECRLAAGSTLEELAHQAGLDASNLSRIERDLQEPSVGCAWRIAAALHIPLGELFCETRTDSVAEPQTRGADRQTDALLKAYFKLSEQNRMLALGIIKLLDRNQREIPD